MAMRLIALVTVVVVLLPVTATSQADTGQIAFGARHAIALRTNGDIVTWGNNVMCQLGRRGGNQNGDPALVLRNGIHIAAAADHSIAVTRDGHVYGWGMNAEGQLGTGNEFDQCEGPALIESLEGKGIVEVATGQDFSVALSRKGELYCAGASDMGRCPAVKGVPNQVFRLVAVPPNAGAFDAVSAGSFHTLALTRDRRLFAFGRGRDGQLGNGMVTNGARIIDALSNVVSFDAGTWHSSAVRLMARCGSGATTSSRNSATARPQTAPSRRRFRFPMASRSCASRLEATAR